MSHSILFVHLGPTVPPWALDAITQARFFNQCPIYFVGSSEALKNFPIDSKLGVTTIATDSLPVTDKHRHFWDIAKSKLDKTFREGFWTFTTERFFYMEAAIAANNLQNIIHLECDNLIYVDLDELMPIFTKHYANLAGTYDCEYRCVPAFIYIRAAESIAPFNDFINHALSHVHANVANDMYLLGAYRKQFGDDGVGQLPVCTSDCPKALASLLDGPPPNPAFYWNLIEEFDSVFDAAALGQYLGGIDQRNTDGRSTVGFINETCVFDPSAYTYAWDYDASGRKIILMKSPNRAYRVNSLHMHAKNTAEFRSF